MCFDLLKGMHNMKRNYKAAAVFAAMTICALSFAGCGEEVDDYKSAVSDTSAADGSADGDSSAEISEAMDPNDNDNSDPDADYDESLHDTSLEEKPSDEESIDESQNMDNASRAQTPSESSSSTDNADFDELFAGNKLDADYEEEIKTALNDSDMINTLLKYKDYWVTEAANANTQLQGSSISDEKKAAIQSEYDEWAAGIDAKYREILSNEKELNGSGTIYKLNAAGQIKQYCRDYAMELYKTVYENDGTFEMAYE